jgi:hypothetical protein
MSLKLSGIKIVFRGDGTIEAPPVQPSVSLDMFVYWLEIALQHLLAADQAHLEVIATWERPKDEGRGRALESEFAASMQSITAAAIAVDAFYAMTKDYLRIAPEEIAAWRSNGTPRPKLIAEVIRRGYQVGPEGFKLMRDRLIDLFKWRDWSVHPPAGFKEPILYDELAVSTEWRFVAFRFHNATALVGFALSLVAQALEHPREEFQDLKKHCERSRSLLAPAVDQWETRFGRLYERDDQEAFADQSQTDAGGNGA